MPLQVMTGIPTVHTHTPDEDSHMLLRSLFILFGSAFASCECSRLLDVYASKIAMACKHQLKLLELKADLQKQQLVEQSSPAISAINTEYQAAGDQERKSVDPADWLTTRSRMKAVKLLMDLPPPDSHTFFSAHSMSP